MLQGMPSRNGITRTRSQRAARTPPLGRHHLRRCPGHAQLVPEVVDDDLVLQPPPLGPPGLVDAPAGDLRQLVEHRAQDQRPPLRVPAVERGHDLCGQEPQQPHGRPDLGDDGRSSSTRLGSMARR
jgi:hypothetical protein